MTIPVTIEGNTDNRADLAVREQAMPTQWTPRFAVSVDDVLAMLAEKRRFFENAMTEGMHYGIIPGCEKPSLWKPGAELLLSSMGLQSKCFDEEPPIIDVMGTDHGGEPFLRYSRMCQVSRNGVMLAQAGGSCNSWEPKYRWRDEKKKCPKCGAQAIIKGNEQYGGGWVCWKKKDGCGAKFGDNDQTIVGQQTGRIPNPDVMDMDNTIKKMADKRAFIAATLLATGCSDIFTQDVEDFGAGGNASADPPAPAPDAPPKPPPPPKPAPVREAPPAREPTAQRPRTAAEVKERAEAAATVQAEEVPGEVVVALLNRFIAAKMGTNKAAFCDWVRKTIPGCASIGDHTTELRKKPKAVEAIAAELDLIEAREAVQ